MIDEQPFHPLGLPPEPPQEQAPPPPPHEEVPPPPPPDRYPFWSYTDVALFIGLSIPCLLLGVGLVRGVAALFRLHPHLQITEPLIGQFVGYGFMLLVLKLIFRLQYDRPMWRSLGWNPLRLPPLIIVIAGLLTAFAVSFFGAVLQTPNVSNPMTRMMEDRGSVILLAIFGITLGPLFEELVFRGFLQPLLVRSAGAIGGVLLAAVPFGLLHFQEYGNSWRHVVLITLAGASFGWMRHRTGSTRSAVLMHASYNALFFFALMAQRKELPHL